MTRLDRYLAREMLLPFAAALVFLTQLLLASQMLAQADVLFGAGVSPLDFLRILADLVPHLLEYVLPVAFLLGAVLGVGRLTEDREVVALSSLGISPAALVRVPLLLGAAVSAVALFIALVVAPAGLHDARRRVDDLIRRNLQGEVRAGVFYDEIPGMTLYAARTGPDGFHDLLIADRTNPSASLVTFARSGRIEAGTDGGLVLVLQDGEVHREEPGVQDYVVARFARARADLGLGAALDSRNQIATSSSTFEMSPGQILRESESGDDENRRYWKTFLWRRIAVPLGILAFGLLAVPIASFRRGGRAFGYAVSLLSVVGYYALLRVGEGLGHDGVLPPWLAANVANLAVVALAGVLLGVLARRGTGAVR
ncbi:MAG: LptF/LptG family permease [Deltaproteobacteria bacterium]